MTAASRKNRILILVIDKVFGSITGDDEKELNELLEHPEEDRKEWDRLMEPENLMDFISTYLNSGNVSDLEAAKKMFDKLTEKKNNKFDE